MPAGTPYALGRFRGPDGDCFCGAVVGPDVIPPATLLPGVSDIESLLAAWRSNEKLLDAAVDALVERTLREATALELGVVIGTEAYRVSRDEALGHVAGYTIVNDITTRDRVFRPDMPGLGTQRNRCVRS